ncbi:MAG: FAD-dependent oxidoreductase [Spirochaetes bacterium]|nr:FAD-dependent oxidoreductase [Spirochaetota bacterium]
MIDLDLAVIGAGPAGLAAAVRARKEGIRDIVVFDRDDRPGGILNQCIHTGFGLLRFDEDLTGPEYAYRFVTEVNRLKVPVELGTAVVELAKDRILTAVNGKKASKYRCRAIILAMGCRERTRNAVMIPGTRPAGIFTAGKAQRLMNIDGYLPGKSIVILGSGDIGMIMARRLALEGCEVKAVVEKNLYAGGLIRNKVQCLDDFSIPLLLGHTVTAIHGEYRVEKVTICTMNEGGEPDERTAKDIECDTLLLSVGLIPENELTRMAGIGMDRSTGGAFVDNILETETEGVFSCGNVLHVSDIVDYVSLEGEIAASGAAGRIRGVLSEKRYGKRFVSGRNIRQIVPQSITQERETPLFIRVQEPTGPARITAGDIARKRVPVARPSEMIELTIEKKKCQKLLRPPGEGTIEVNCREE